MGSLQESLRVLAGKVVATKGSIVSEQHTKDAFIVPLIRLLGYDTFNPLEVVPEYTCEFSANRSEKVDYVIMVDSKPLILVEAKDCRVVLGDEQVMQLERYFMNSSAQIGVLTNGIEFWFFTDSYVEGEMDIEPFHKMNIEVLSRRDVEVLLLLSKDSINIETIRGIAYKPVFKESLRLYLTIQSERVDQDFIEFVKKEISSRNMPDEDIAEVIRDVMKELISSDEPSRLHIKSKKLAVGTSGEFALEDCTSSIITGARLEYLKINEFTYECKGWKSLITAFIEYEIGVGIKCDELVNLTRNTGFLRTEPTGLRSPVSYRGIYFEGNMSALSLLMRFKDLLLEVGLDYSNIILKIKSKKD